MCMAKITELCQTEMFQVLDQNDKSWIYMLVQNLEHFSFDQNCIFD